MTSARKIEANRANSRKSTGPRTAAGKATASRNALRHGFAARAPSHPPSSPEIERLARAFCQGDNDPLLFEQALVIAANEQVLQSIRAQRSAVIERLRDTQSVALAKGDNSYAVIRLIGRQAERALARVHARLKAARKGSQNASTMVVTWPLDLEVARKKIQERNEQEAIKEAAPDLVRLERYYQRTWREQKRAIQRFMNIKLMLDLQQDGGSLQAFEASQ